MSEIPPPPDDGVLFDATYDPRWGLAFVLEAVRTAALVVIAIALVVIA